MDWLEEYNKEIKLKGRKIQTEFLELFKSLFISVADKVFSFLINDGK